jgi:hypothetical protein
MKAHEGGVALDDEGLEGKDESDDGGRRPP